MVLKHKPIYQCDGCSIEFEDPDKVRIFESLIKNGDQTKLYIETGMYCINCVPLALDFENKNPETVKIVDPIKALADTEDQFEKLYNKISERMNLNKIIDSLNVDIRNFKELFFGFVKETEKDLKQLNHQFESLYDFVHKLEFQKLQELKNITKDFIKDTKETIPNSRPKPNELIENDDQEPETINENIDSETEEYYNSRDEFGEETGDYLILKLIDNETTEKQFAQIHGYKDVKDLRATYGNKSLVGLYYSINKFINNLERTSESNIKTPVKIINKMFFGVPSIVERKVFIYGKLGIALIEKENFDDKIEPIVYELPEEADIEIPNEHEIIIRTQEESETPTVNKMINKFVKEASEEIKPKKWFSKRNIGDDYI